MQETVGPILPAGAHARVVADDIAFYLGSLSFSVDARNAETPLSVKHSSIGRYRKIRKSSRRHALQQPHCPLPLAAFLASTHRCVVACHVAGISGSNACAWCNSRQV